MLDSPSQRRDDPRVSGNTVSFGIRGSYFESCNCEAICPCRMVGGVKGGRSTYGICYGALSWRIEEGVVGEVDVAGLAVVLVMQYDDDEPGSPWTLVLHVDERGSEAQREALADVFLGRVSGPHVDILPWVRKARHLVDVRTSVIELTPEGEGYRLRVGDAVLLTATRRVENQDAVACVVSGYERVGTELYADELAVDDDPFAWELSGNCAFTAGFEYASA
jgi:hypothetical protein